MSEQTPPSPSTSAGSEEFGGLTEKQSQMMAVIQAHVIAETVTRDVDATLSTMTEAPYLYYNGNRHCAVGREEVRRFYATQLIGQYLPPDGEMITASLVMGERHVFSEVVFRFTHTTQMNWLLPDIAPTGKRVELAMSVIVEVRDGKLANERVYWDQASLLYQVGLLEKGDLPIAGAENARALLTLTRAQVAQVAQAR